MKNKIKAEIVSHSKRKETGEEIITYKLTFPRIILSEVNTYKMMEKNTSSCLHEDTFIDVFWKDKGKYDLVQIKRLFEFQERGLELPEIVSFTMRDKEHYIVEDDYEENFIKQKIGKVFKSGVKRVYRIRFDKDLFLDCTDEHRLLAYNALKGFEWITLKDFQLEADGDKVFGDFALLSKAFYGISMTDFEINNHRVPNLKNETIRFYGLGSFILERRDGKILNPCLYRNIKGISCLGEFETYDIEVDGKYHNFIANGIVVHNSRAIPFEKMVEVVEKEPFVPLAWQLQHRGMQGTEYLTDPKLIEHKNNAWLTARNEAVFFAKTLVGGIRDVEEQKRSEEHFDFLDKFIPNTELSKNYGNRIIEPWTWVVQLVTGTRESFEHLFEQRCPVYPGGCKSWKELCDIDSNYTMEASTLERLQVNKGQAEIHFMDLAEKMYDALNESKPTLYINSLSDFYCNFWHIPFEEEIKERFGDDMSTEDIIKMSVCLTAKISYTKIGDENSITIEKAREMYERLKNAGHWSCFGHIAKCMTAEEYETWIKGKVQKDSYTDGYCYEVPKEAKGYNKQLRGFISLRQYVEDEVDLNNI